MNITHSIFAVVGALLSASACASIPNVSPADATARAPRFDFHARQGLGRTGERLRAGEPITVAYLGGSITEMKGWREQMTTWLTNYAHGSNVKEIAAGIGGTGSALGVFRLGRDVLVHKPDLLIVEFAVNDNCTPPANVTRQMEGIVRQTWRQSPKTDIAFFYTIEANMTNDYLRGVCPRTTSIMEGVAAHYGIPSICLAHRVTDLLARGELIMQPAKTALPGNPILFAKDGTHPLPAGHALYIAAITNALPTLLAAPPTDHAATLSATPLARNNLEWAQQVPVTKAMLKGADWFKQADAGNRPGNVHVGARAGDRLTFRFRGTHCGIYDIIGPDSCLLKVWVDGVRKPDICRFDKYCSWYRPSDFTVYDGPDGEHTVVLEIADTLPDRNIVRWQLKDPDRELADPKYKATRFRPCHLLLVGEMIHI